MHKITTNIGDSPSEETITRIVDLARLNRPNPVQIGKIELVFEYRNGIGVPYYLTDAEGKCQPYGNPAEVIMDLKKLLDQTWPETDRQRPEPRKKPKRRLLNKVWAY